MLITYWIWSACPPRLRSKGDQIDYPDKPEVCRTRSTVTFYNRDLHDAINVFDKPALLELRRAAHLQLVFKTSFSRSNPGSRGQATTISNSSETLPALTLERTFRSALRGGAKRLATTYRSTKHQQINNERPE